MATIPENKVAALRAFVARNNDGFTAVQSKAQCFIVRWRGNYAVQFHLRGYSLVADDEATLFIDKVSADEKARQSGLRHGEFTVEANQ